MFKKEFNHLYKGNKVGVSVILGGVSVVMYTCSSGQSTSRLTQC